MTRRNFIGLAVALTALLLGLLFAKPDYHNFDRGPQEPTESTLEKSGVQEPVLQVSRTSQSSGLGAVFSVETAQALEPFEDAIVPSLSSGYDLGASFEPVACETELLNGAFSGLTRDTPVMIYPGDYFQAVSAKNGWDFRPAGIFYSGEIRLDPVSCLRANTETNSPAWKKVYDAAKALIIHEAAHALDLEVLDGISSTVDFPVTEIGHASHMKNGAAELFAFCMQNYEGFETRDRCPAGNRDAMSGVFELLDIAAGAVF